ncbi:MAG: GAF domain-containing protein, partial [Promethearchaeia archaeon]
EKNSQTLQFINTFISSMKEPIVVLNREAVIMAYNESFAKRFQTTEKRLKEKKFFNIDNGRWNIKLLKDQFKKAKNNNKHISGIEINLSSQEQEQMLLNVEIKSISFGDKQFFIFSIDQLDEEKINQELLKEIQIRDKIADIFLTTSDEETYHQVLQIILEIMDSKIGYFGYINEEGALVCPSMTREVWDKCQISDKDIVFPKEKWGGIWGESLRKEKSLIRSEDLNPPAGHIPLKNALCVPIFYKDNVIGQIVVSNKETEYKESDKKLLKKIATQISPILHARLERDKKEQEKQQIEARVKRSTRKEIIDALDKQILHQLFLNGKKSLNQIKKKVLKANGKKMSHTGINNRINKLIDANVLKIQGNVNLKQLGFQAAFFLIELENYDLLKEYISKAKECPRVFLIAPTTGNFHLALGIIGKKIDHINSCLNYCDVVSRKEIKNSKIIFAPQLEVPKYTPLDLFFNLANHEKLKEFCQDCESYINESCSGCGF